MMRKLSIQLVRLVSTSLVVTMMLAGVLVIAQQAGAAPNFAALLAPPFAGPPPEMISYQGVVNVSGSPFDGSGYFKFAIVDSPTGDGSTNYWSNDGVASGMPATAVQLPVSSGRFNVLLGDTSVAGMSQVLTDDDVSNTDAYLRVWFSQSAGGPFEALDPNQRIASVAYALRAASADVANSAIRSDSFSISAIQILNQNESFSLNPGNSQTANIVCPFGTRIVAGGETLAQRRILHSTRISRRLTCRVQIPGPYVF